MAALPNTMAAQQAPTAPTPAAWVNPYDAVVNEHIRRMEQPQAPMYSPEEVERRRQQNDMEYQLGALAQVSGHAPLQAVGGQVFKQALAQRQPHVTERGVSDPLSGKFSYSPSYLRERDEATLSTLQGRQATAQQQHIEAEIARREREAADVRSDRRDATLRRELLTTRLGAGGGEVGAGASTQIGSDPTTQQPVFRNNKSGALFTYDVEGRAQPYRSTVAPKVSSAQPTEDERKAGGWFTQAKLAYDTMEDAIAKDPDAAKLGTKEMTVSVLPKVGEKLAYAQMSPQRQRFTTAAASMSEAVLRAATGAGVNESEARQKVQELTPRWGESAEARADKRVRMQSYLDSLLVRAGRAAPKDAAPQAGGSGSKTVKFSDLPP